MSKKWYYIEDCIRSRASEFDRLLKADNEQDALDEALFWWGYLTDHDKRDRDRVYIAYAGTDEDGCIDWETCYDVVEIWDGKEEKVFRNSEGLVFNSTQWNAIVATMDGEIREELNRELAPCSMQEFFTAYAEAHEERFSEQWELDKANPCW